MFAKIVNFEIWENVLNMAQDQKLLKNVKSRNWKHTGKPGMFLLIRSMQIHGFRKHLKTAMFKGDREDISIHYGNKKYLVVVNRDSLRFSEEAMIFFLSNHQVVDGFVDQRQKSIVKSIEKIKIADKYLKKKDERNLVLIINELLSDFYEVSFWKYYLSRLFEQFAQSEDLTDEIIKIIDKYNQCKNSQMYYNFEGNSLVRYVNFLVKNKGLKIKGLDIMKYFHIKEFVNFINEYFDHETITKIIDQRKGGYVSVNLKNAKHQNLVLNISHEDADLIIQHIHDLKSDKENTERQKSEIIGRVIYKADSIIQGECVVARGINGLKNKLDFKDKILVTTKTTPKFFPYIKNIRAMIVDAGGLTSHAAILARESKLPCIVGTIIGTKKLKTGDRVEMNMITGVIRKI